MAINATSLQSPAYLARIKAAVLRAVRKAHRPGAVRGIGHAEVYNRRDMPSLSIVARQRGGFEIFDHQDRDVTDLIKAALVQFHQRQGV